MAAERHITEVELQKVPSWGDAGTLCSMQTTPPSTGGTTSPPPGTPASSLRKGPTILPSGHSGFLPRLQRPHSFPSSDPVMKICFLILEVLLLP